MYELMGELKHCHIMQLPLGKTGRGALEFWKQEVISVKEDLEQFYGITITEDKIRDAIKLRNRERKAVLDFFEVARLKPSPISGYEINTVISSNEFSPDLEEKIAFLNQRTAELKDLYESLDSKEGIIFDLGMVPTMKYYTGFMIKGYSDQSANPILSGGRYDDLLPRFNVDKTAVGFCFHMNHILKAIEKEGE